MRRRRYEEKFYDAREGGRENEMRSFLLIVKLRMYTPCEKNTDGSLEDRCQE